MRKMRVSFDLDVSMFLSMLAAGNSSMRIEILGDAPKMARQLNGKAAQDPAAFPSLKPKLQLEAPKKKHKRKTPQRARGGPTIYNIILGFLTKHKDRAVDVKELEAPVMAIGGAKTSVSPQLVMLRQKGFVKKLGGGKYQIAARGLKSMEEATAKNG